MTEPPMIEPPLIPFHRYDVLSASYRRVLRDRRLEVWGRDRERAVASAWREVARDPEARPEWTRRNQEFHVFRKLGRVVVSVIPVRRKGEPQQFSALVVLDRVTMRPVEWRPDPERIRSMSRSRTVVKE